MLLGVGPLNSPEARGAPKNHTQMHLHGEESHNVLPHAMGGKRVLQNRDNQCACLPHTDSGRSNEYKQILVPLWKRAAQLSILMLFSNVAQQDAMFLQVVFNSVAWLKGYTVPPKTACALDGKVKSRTSC